MNSLIIGGFKSEDMEFRKIIVDGIETDYYVSENGDVLSMKSRQLLSPFISNCGYVRVCISVPTKNGKLKPQKFSVHRLVALAFIPRISEDADTVNHIDGNKLNNNVKNLEWVTQAENNSKAYEIGLKTGKHGEASHFAKYKKNQVIKACEYMESGEYTIPDISLLTGIDKAMLRLIRNRSSWVNVSKNYDVENCKHNHKKYADEQIEAVFKLLEENELSIYDISDKTGVKVSTITKILSGKRPKRFSEFYKLYDISNYKRDKPLPEIKPEIMHEINMMIASNYNNKQITEIIHDKYGLNEDRILCHVYKIREHKQSSTTIERQ